MGQSSLGWNDTDDFDDDILPMSADDRASQSLESPAFEQARPDASVADAAQAAKASAAVAPPPDSAPAAQPPAPPTAPPPAYPPSRRLGNIADHLPPYQSPYAAGYAPRSEYAAQFTQDEAQRQSQYQLASQQRAAQLARAINASDPYQADNGRWMKQAVDPANGDIHEIDLQAGGAGRLDEYSDAANSVANPEPVEGGNGTADNSGQTAPQAIGQDHSSTPIEQVVQQRALVPSVIELRQGTLAQQQQQLAALDAQIDRFGTAPGAVLRKYDDLQAKAQLAPDDPTIQQAVANATRALQIHRAEHPEFAGLAQQRDQLTAQIRQEQAQWKAAQQQNAAALASPDYARAVASLPPPGQSLSLGPGDISLGDLQARAAQIIAQQPALSHVDAITQAAQEAQRAGAQTIAGASIDATLQSLAAAQATPQPPPADSAWQAFLRPIESKIAPALGAAVGGQYGSRAGLVLGGGPESPTGLAGAVAGDILGGALGSAGVQYLQDKIMGADWTRQQATLIQQDLESHPLATRLGDAVPMLISMLGGAPGKTGAIGKTVQSFLQRTAEATGGKIPYLSRALAALPGNLVLGARTGAAQSAGNAVTGQGDWSQIPADTIKSAVTMGPLSFIPYAGSMLGRLTAKPAGDAATLSLSNALYDHFVEGKPIDWSSQALDTVRNFPVFVALALAHEPFQPKGGAGSNQDGSSKPNPTPPPLPADALADAQKQAVDAAQQADAKIQTAQGNGDAASLATALDQQRAAQQEAHTASQAETLSIDPQVRRGLARLGNPTGDFDAGEAKLAQDPQSHFALSSIGESVRDAYVPLQHQTALAAHAERYGVPLDLAQRYADQHTGLAAMRDVRDTLTGSNLDPAKAQALQDAGLLHETVEPDGSSEAADRGHGSGGDFGRAKLRVTDDAIPLLQPTVQRALAIHPDKLAYTQTPGNPADAFAAHVQRGLQRLGENAEAAQERTLENNPSAEASSEPDTPSDDPAINAPSDSPAASSPTIPGLSAPDLGTGADTTPTQFEHSAIPGLPDLGPVLANADLPAPSADATDQGWADNAPDGDGSNDSGPLPPPPPPKPTGPKPVRESPVSRVVEMSIHDKSLFQWIQRAIKMIDEVHDDGALPKLQILGSLAVGQAGQFRIGRDPQGRLFGTITISRKGPWPALTTLHEIGHALDVFIFGQGKGSGFATDPLWEPVRQAIDASDATAELTRLGSPTHQQYHLQAQEQWARAYAQYIAEKSGDPALLADLAKVAAGPEPWRQWETADFAPIRTAIDAIFQQKGWLP